MDDALLSPDQSLDLDRHKVARITFEDTSFLGSQQAALSYASDLDKGYIWLVNTNSGRDCKGEWTTKGESGSWWLLCKDGLKATGEISTPQSGTGSGQGKTEEGQPMRFSFAPAQ